MPSKKILVVFIILFAVVISVWFIVKKQESLKQITASETASVTAESPIQIKNTEYDWKKIITNVDSKKVKVENVIGGEDEFDENNLTDQISRDIFYKLMLASKEGDVTSDTAKKIAASSLASSQYTNTSSIVYLSSNLKITQDSGKESKSKYVLDLTNVFQKRQKEMSLETDPEVIFQEVVKNNIEKPLEKLTPMINTRKEIVKDLLNITVPEKGVKVHLDLINAYSKLISNLESMKLVYIDPIKASVGLSEYEDTITKLQIAIKNINTFATN